VVQSVIVFAAYFAVWSIVHSLLASLRAKRWAERALGSGVVRWYRIGFNVVAAITFLPLLGMVVLLPDRVLYVIPPSWRWLTLVGQTLALFALLRTLLQTGPLRFAGLAQLLPSGSLEDESLQLRGFYCHVRHPLYLFSLVFVWLTPLMTVNVLTLNVLITLYFYIGSIFEESKLLIQFGRAYDHYRRHVPRLLPRLKRCHPPALDGV
jgi:protein-S-isoprenylcysteine O-methyltransferase Ste14